MTDNKIKVLAVVGPTASGKTALAVQLAKKFNGEIVSADSMQIYKEMNIASAKPTKEEMQGIPHYMIDYLPPQNQSSVSDYVQMAHKIIKTINDNKKLPIVAGGTGLYIDSLLNNLSFAKEEGNQIIREKLNERLNNEGIQQLYDELKTIDPEAAANIHINNTKRVLRALEIYYSTGKTMTRQKIDSRAVPSPYDTVYIGLKCADRENLYNRINKRVDNMLEQGLLNEAKEMLGKDLSATAGAAIGYKELKPYFDGAISLNEAVENLKRETRRYAKRQLTWFMRNGKINWIDIDLLDFDISKVLRRAVEICERGGIYGN
ncbi:MAG: tRNA (adenosine(37)-N6)-dimethylallyltransferase MiaA [Clostridiales bacterium]|nr:tRNA (adenosine(37)-N6)-dimethylallyltransferase MiaA [Clostridiales bacterium]